MKKLLIVATIPLTLSSFFPYITRHLQAKGWRVDGMATGISSDAKCLELFDQVWDVDWSRNPLKPQNLIVVPQQIREVFAKEEYDIVNVTTPVASFVTRYALNDLIKHFKLTVIYTAQGFHFYRGASGIKNSIFLGLESLAKSWTDYLVVVNHEDEEAAKRYRLAPIEQIRYIPGTGLNVERFHRHTIAESELIHLREELSLPPDTPLFLSVAEFIKRKHPQDVLRAFARLGRPEAYLAFAGNGPLMAQMQQLAYQLGIQNQVRFLGVRRDIPTLMRAAVATVLASEQEGLPNCVMESMSMQTPVIGTSIRGTRDLLEGGCGLLFKVGDIEALAAAMAWILDNPQAAKSMGERGRERIADYEVPRILEQYEALYAEAISRREFSFAKEFRSQNSEGATALDGFPGL
ncbi:glycosyltransferase [Aetokthonos hydrillicola Thurmond2011]|jgi:glycosyltransferase involved in cell wall biosynthesis|uniref:Glycosyltransferase n=1 Tax=Aetokthonos hydrillicola Thurmond2011 TaxID=2712845 RepID=A0AAP5MAU1_9CYAN|nr:glycosyltransferase [Aetokthonos hydrillicola]MBO3460070.1 glycosyltransferase family 4 protein [Aetokthonos hydrillicola CCALA 1050]MBW4589531.1 glycosyltransferase [Aetokthonos hydrillicola CCALA 1050]MDR9896044.1 glycosyltransferase [Aetokthonos hydrillicola Thurmond2011]